MALFIRPYFLVNKVIVIHAVVSNVDNGWFCDKTIVVEELSTEWSGDVYISEVKKPQHRPI